MIKSLKSRLTEDEPENLNPDTELFDFDDYSDRMENSDSSVSFNQNSFPQFPVSIVDEFLDEKDRKVISFHLHKVLSDSFMLYVKTLNFHWNVKGSHFLTLHRLFDEQAKELMTAIDLVAERIRALGFAVPATFSELHQATTVKEEKSVLNSDHMISILCESQTEVIRSICRVLTEIESFSDLPTTDLLTQRLFAHQKNVWILRSLMN